MILKIPIVQCQWSNPVGLVGPTDRDHCSSVAAAAAAVVVGAVGKVQEVAAVG